MEVRFNLILEDIYKTLSTLILSIRLKIYRASSHSSRIVKSNLIFSYLCIYLMFVECLIFVFGMLLIIKKQKSHKLKQI